MHVTRIEQAPRYEAPNHFDMTCLRLQGREAGPAVQLWMGLSVIEPGGRTGLDPSPIEKHYFVVSGELEVTGEIDGVRRTETLRAQDSCRFAPGEARQLVNRGPEPVRVLLAMPLQPPAASPT